MRVNGRPVIGITAGVESGRLNVRREYADAVSKAGGLPVLVPAFGPDFSRYAGLIDGLLLPGGGDIDPAYYGESRLYEGVEADRGQTDFEIGLFHEIIKADKPALGICYGMQLMDVALGGSLYQDIEAQIVGPQGPHGHKEVNHREPHEIELDPGGAGPIGLFGGKRGRHRVNSSHHQAIREPGRGVEVFARAEDGVAEAFFVKGYKFVVGIEWHPERLKGDPLSEGVFSAFIGAAQ